MTSCCPTPTWYTVLSPRGERTKTVLPVYKHFTFEKIEDPDASWDERATCTPVTCEVHLGAGPCDHGWEYETVVEVSND